MGHTNLLCGVLLLGAVLTSESVGSVLPDPGAVQWAMPIAAPGLRNCYKVTEGLYRGGRLHPAGAAVLESMGVKTVVSLCMRRSDWKSVAGTGLDYCQIPVKAWRPEEEEIVQFLKIATDRSRQPVYVYCNRGAERTGMMCAVYRIVVCGWTKEEALCEMTQGPFGYHPIWKKVRMLIWNLDVECIKRRAGLAGP